MSRKPRKASRKPPTTIKLYPDGHKRKRAPNGIRSVLLAIQYYWLALHSNNKEMEHLTPARFCLEGGFEQAFKEARGRYPAMKKNKTEIKLGRLLQKLTNGEHNIEFVHLLAFAQYVGLPLSLFMLFTQMVSDELRSSNEETDFPAHAVRVLRRVRLVIEAAERQIISSQPADHIFVHHYDEFDDDGPHLMARASMLKFWSDIFNSSEAYDAASEVAPATTTT